MKRFLIVLVLLGVLVSACGTHEPVSRQEADQVDLLVHPESDNSYGWSLGSRVRINIDVFYLKVRVNDEMTSHSELQASGSGTGYMSGGFGYGVMSYRMWQEGKGILPVTVLSISPEFHGISAGETILLKTSDLKAMALPNGSVTEFICNEDVEILSPVANSQILTTDRLTYELDNCRMTLPTYKLGE